MGLAAAVYVGHHDLTQMDFFLWGEVKLLVFETPLDTEEKLVARVTEAAMAIFQTSGIF